MCSSLCGCSWSLADLRGSSPVPALDPPALQTPPLKQGVLDPRIRIANFHFWWGQQEFSAYWHSEAEGEEKHTRQGDFPINIWKLQSGWTGGPHLPAPWVRWYQGCKPDAAGQTGHDLRCYHQSCIQNLAWTWVTEQRLTAPCPWPTGTTDVDMRSAVRAQAVYSQQGSDRSPFLESPCWVRRERCVPSSKTPEMSQGYLGMCMCSHVLLNKHVNN